MTPERRAAIEKACVYGDMLFPEVVRELLSALDAAERERDELITENAKLKEKVNEYQEGD